MGGKTWKNKEHNILNGNMSLSRRVDKQTRHIKETGTWSGSSKVVCTAGAISFSRERKKLETVISIGF